MFTLMNMCDLLLYFHDKNFLNFKLSPVYFSFFYDWCLLYPKKSLPNPRL